ncbi:ubiquitin-conjugating enzyme/RWD-like protein [Paraphysoderma sedebokerense]|nr:ubiquitin-conjugating enzyme/RWD-like protein [Paraphysoderma sedebokerense]
MASAAALLAKQFKELSTNPIPGFVVNLLDDNIFEWDIAIIGPPSTIYEGGYFKATMKFPQEYPFLPPSFAFNSKFFHPNVYEDGRLCISILHPPGDDPLSGETAAERWNPTQTVESVLISIVSLLADPNTSSPANVDAGVMFRNDFSRYSQIVKSQVEESKSNIPSGFVLPTSEVEFQPKKPEKDDIDEDSFWYEEEDYDDFEDDEDAEDDEEEEDEGIEDEE